ncbi:uncharacterized protein L969DRAFT_65508 [Mixia osmundae IAM 14324]|uniref:uncharacterized protein n=1 Tax=Mixia osmundae (strain CBS 9802 / IAM 14324 / JCM 22182 / KY 12970) TaxID=764103 RepID=UPI0004A54E57|nr:uncharacterized protein L969DRAFT_65508 [Mixia osmundae IAM 14324]KEI37687.1 hypothetical protein L969DRAFT_65508 [Mixia osmundae IAM 14324]
MELIENSRTQRSSVRRAAATCPGPVRYPSFRASYGYTSSRIKVAGISGASQPSIQTSTHSPRQAVRAKKKGQPAFVLINTQDLT